MSDLYFGGDIGSNGCVALICKGVLVDWFRLANGGYPELLLWLQTLCSVRVGRRYVALEHVHWRPGDQRKPTQIETMFRNAAKMELCLELANITGDMVEPQTWQLEFGLGGIDDYNERKRAALKVAKELYSSVSKQITLDAADGILIATYGWRKETGVLTNGRDPNKETREGTGIQWESRQKI